jgi:hypothetical protein
MISIPFSYNCEIPVINLLETFRNSFDEGPVKGIASTLQDNKHKRKAQPNIQVPNGNRTLDGSIYEF